MVQAIIYKQDSGIIAIAFPAAEAVAKYGIDYVARRLVPGPKTVYDVPTGEFEHDDSTGAEREVMAARVVTYPFKIIDATEIPSDNTFRDAWTVDDAYLTDGVGGIETTTEEPQ